MIGPAAGGAIIALFGVGVCFLINAASFLGPLVALLAMDVTKLYRPEVRAARTPAAVRAGLSYVKGRRDLLVPLLMMAIIGTLAYEFQVSIPLMAHSAFHLGATGFGLLYAAMGAGAVVSGVTLAGKVPGRVRTLVISAAAFGLALAASAAAPGPVAAAVGLAFAGAASVVYSSSTNGTLQIRADPSMRGRVVALYVMAFMGSTAIGGPLVGVVGQVFGPRASLGVGAVGCLAAVVLRAGVRAGRAPPGAAAGRCRDRGRGLDLRPAAGPDYDRVEISPERRSTAPCCASAAQNASTTTGSNCVSGAAAQLGQRLGAARGGRYGRSLSHRVEGVADGDDAGAERDVLAGQAVGVAGAVPALVAGADELGRPAPARGPRRRSARR